ncbi:MAG: translation initiation factor IF-2 N-terminal domain-containing protein, partial [Endomicrobium sp.]|nr:translation initiation factor IF-2 N-terminal domain-containing protein [Endomicrobium sp.]
MPIKKDSKEKVIKKKTISVVPKTKDVSAKKTIKKTATTTSKKTVKAKISTKKTELKNESKTAKTKITKSSIAKKKTVKKTALHKKKQIEQNTAAKIVEKREDEIIKGEPKKEESEKIKESAVKQDTDGQNKKNDSVVNNVKVETPNKYKQKTNEQKTSIPVKTKEVKSNVTVVTKKDVISINELITVRELADKMRLRSGYVLKKLLSMGSLATINQRLDIDTASLLANEFGYDIKMESIYSEEKIEAADQHEDPSKLKSRSPIVTIMGHVDHGKTSLLDAIRSSNIACDEHGGITQHIGAYKVQVPCGGYITFLDTPGHEAFTAMRSRGSQVTDIVVLVVSATDGVMPQTVESINHAKAANVPIIVAVNKIDMPAADPQKIRQELSNYGFIPEEWGGDTIMIDISAKQRTNINLLLEMIFLKAEMMELKANQDRNAEGILIEARLDSNNWVVATLVIQTGTLKIGDNIV